MLQLYYENVLWRRLRSERTAVGSRLLRSISVAVVLLTGVYRSPCYGNDPPDVQAYGAWSPGQTDFGFMTKTSVPYVSQQR